MKKEKGVSSDTPSERICLEYPKPELIQSQRTSKNKITILRPSIPITRETLLCRTSTSGFTPCVSQRHSKYFYRNIENVVKNIFQIHVCPLLTLFSTVVSIILLYVVKRPPSPSRGLFFPCKCLGMLIPLSCLQLL